MSLFEHAVFTMSAEKISDLPPPVHPEIAFAGRSNSGKSSAINTLANRTRLAFASKTPGRTQLINFFQLRSEALVVDLPGYGYAKVPEAIRLRWQGILEHYLSQRTSLVGLIVIMDSRHPLTDLDWQLLRWFLPTGKPVHVLLSKSDKLTRGPAMQTLQKVRKALSEYEGQVTVQLFSSLKKTGKDEVEQAVSRWLGVSDSSETAEVTKA